MTESFIGHNMQGVPVIACATDGCRAGDGTYKLMDRHVEVTVNQHNQDIDAAIVEQQQALDEQHQAEVPDFLQSLIVKSKSEPLCFPKKFDPMRFRGTVQWPVDGIAYQESVREEWPSLYVWREIQ
ncbi:MAG: hypothetical protein RIQ52_2109 [Pseudomonadota bacterium]